MVGLFDVHLMVAQSWAWATMINDRVPEQGIEAALESTFRGEKPCPLCRSIRKEKQRKQQDEPAPLPEQRPIAKACTLASSCPIRCIQPAYIRLPVLLRDLAFPEHEIEQPDSPPPRLMMG